MSYTARFAPWGFSEAMHVGINAGSDLVPAQGSALSQPPPASIQPHGAILVFERAGFTLAHASETVSRLLPKDLTAILGAPVEATFDVDIATRIRGVGTGAEERRVISIQGRTLDLRLVGTSGSVLVEIEPTDEETDVGLLGTWLETAAELLAQSATLADIARIGAAKLAEVSAFGLVAVARALPNDRIQILAEVNDGTLPPLQDGPTALVCSPAWHRRRGLPL